MLLFKQLFHIYRTFGLKHVLKRVAYAVRAKVNELSRNARHWLRVRGMNKESRIVVNCLGKDFELKVGDLGLHRDLLADRIREPVATSLMMKYVQPDFVILDAGANIGYFSLLLADRCKKVYAVEPDRDNFEELNGNIGRNGVRNVKSFNLAFSDTAEPLIMEKAAKANWHTTSKLAGSRRGQVVDAMTIDDFCATEGFVPDIIKMDIEGFERFVIPGAKSTLETVKYLFFELHSGYLSIEEVNALLDVIENSGLKILDVIRYDRPGLWREECVSVMEDIRKGDFGVYELIYARV